MTSIGATEFLNNNYTPTFKIRGQLYRRIGSLIPKPNEKPNFYKCILLEMMNHSAVIGKATTKI